ncbi:creatininase family protein [Lentisphaerota bacterium ZTH]|nr:creatininase family protein [Lentisphaerota bacterium]WET06076.1 creatininase family protein [Lentisphaerota bacterium ZTH]
MTKEVRIKYLLPEAIHMMYDSLPLIILPIGVLEWHGPHLPIGTDIINAENLAKKAAQEVGGAVFPPIYFGVCHIKSKEELINLGMDKDAKVIGMDHPKAHGLYKSFYYSDELLALSLKETLNHIVCHGYKYVCIITGHSAPPHTSIINSIAEDYNFRHDVKIMTFNALLEIEHAAIQETALMEYYNKGYVNKSKLPKLPKKLKYSEFSVVDPDGFLGMSTNDFAVSNNYDPRNSSKEKGKTIFNSLLKKLCSEIELLIK